MVLSLPDIFIKEEYWLEQSYHFKAPKTGNKILTNLFPGNKKFQLSYYNQSSCNYEEYTFGNINKQNLQTFWSLSFEKYLSKKNIR